VGVAGVIGNRGKDGGKRVRGEDRKLQADCPCKGVSLA
jgi:hypothetical protein